jgi:uncharacterized protein YjbI with pentapeptide repeats
MKGRKRVNVVWRWLERFEKAAPTALVRHLPLTIIVGLSLCTLLLWQIPNWEVSSLRSAYSEIDVIEAEDKARATLAQIMGGAFILAGLGFTWWRIEVARQGQITERFTRAVEQLGSADMAIRVGAVFALERIAHESEKDRASIIDLLAAFTRDHCGLSNSGTAPAREAHRISTDAQTALTVLGRLVKNEDLDKIGRTVDLRETDLRGATLDDSNFPGAVFTGACLDGASLVRTNLRKAVFLSASLEMANLTDANLDLADLEQARAPHADLSGAYLAGANLKGTHLEGADLNGACLEGMILTLTHLEGADLRDTVGTPFMFPLPIAQVFIDDRTQLSPNVYEWLKQNAPSRWKVS